MSARPDDVGVRCRRRRVVGTLGGRHPRTLRPIWCAEELGLALQIEPIGPRTGETQTDAFGDINAKRKVPALVHGDFLLSESLSICRYLRDVARATVPAPSTAGALWWPTDALGRAREDEWCCFALAELDETALYVMRRHRDLAAIYGEAPSAVAAAAAHAERMFAVVARRLDAARWLAGDGFGLADLMMTTCIDWAIAYDVPVPGAVRSWRDDIVERPAYQRAKARNRPRAA